ncbi:MAG: hypothetical protein WKG01_08280 [Kofleriaceae bacterium]
MQVRRAAVLMMFGLAACGGDDGVDLPEGCDFLEAEDATNNTLAMPAGTAEVSGLALGASTVYCGKVDPGHFEPAENGNGLVDIDAFTFSVPVNSGAVLTLTGTGLDSLVLAQGLLLDGAGDPVTLASFVPAIEHGIGLAAVLPAGEYQVAVGALNAADIAEPLAYRAKVVTYELATRCAAPATTTFVEANDGTGNTGNDMVEVRYVANAATATVATTDTPEPSNIAATPGTPALIQGSAAMSLIADEYLDRDTYAFTVADASHLVVRVEWPAVGADLDFFLFGANTPSITAPGGTLTSASPGELELIPVTANTPYWLWVGAFDDSAGLPLDYRATLCAETFEP